MPAGSARVGQRLMQLQIILIYITIYLEVYSSGTHDGETSWIIDGSAAADRICVS